jgi:hypothetical protein
MDEVPGGLEVLLATQKHRYWIQKYLAEFMDRGLDSRARVSCTASDRCPRRTGGIALPTQKD